MTSVWIQSEAFLLGHPAWIALTATCLSSFPSQKADGCRRHCLPPINWRQKFAKSASMVVRVYKDGLDRIDLKWRYQRHNRGIFGTNLCQIKREWAAATPCITCRNKPHIVYPPLEGLDFCTLTVSQIGLGIAKRGPGKGSCQDVNWELACWIKIWFRRNVRKILGPGKHSIGRETATAATTFNSSSKQQWRPPNKSRALSQ